VSSTQTDAALGAGVTDNTLSRGMLVALRNRP
jgi:hypothetical protein